MPENNGITLINQFRSWLADFRAAANSLVDQYQRRVDELELRISKENISQPTARIEDDEVFELELKGGPEKRV